MFSHNMNVKALRWLLSVARVLVVIPGLHSQHGAFGQASFPIKRLSALWCIVGLGHLLLQIHLVYTALFNFFIFGPVDK